MTDSGQSSTGKGAWSPWAECVRHWRTYAIAWAIAIVAALVVCAGIPTTYTAQVKIADEHKETDLLIGLNNFASWAKGAINDRKGLRKPDVYYRAVTSPSFIEEMSHVRVENYGTDYYHYILQHHKESWWKKMSQAFSSDTLTERERVTAVIQESIRSKVSSKYGTVIMQVTDQDPIVAAMMVDSVCAHLQQKLMGHARLRAFRDLMNASAKMQQAKQDYEHAREEYNRYSDTHADITSVKAMSMEDHLLNEYERTFGNYAKECEQYIRAKAFVEKLSLKFAVLKNATVNPEPAGPSKTGHIMALWFIATVLVSWAVLAKRKFMNDQSKP